MKLLRTLSIAALLPAAAAASDLGCAPSMGLAYKLTEKYGESVVDEREFTYARRRSLLLTATVDDQTWWTEFFMWQREVITAQLWRSREKDSWTIIAQGDGDLSCIIDFGTGRPPVLDAIIERVTGRA